MNALMTNLLAWLRWGCEREEAHTLRRKIFNVNAAALIAILSMAFFAVLDVLARNPGLTRAFLLQIPFYFIFAAVPWLNRQGYAGLARWIVSLSLTAMVAVNVWLANGSWLDLHFYFILFAVVGVAFFLRQQWASVVFLFVLNAALFVYCEFVGVDPDPLLMMLEQSTTMLFRTVAVVTSLFTVLFIAWLGEHVVGRIERKLDALSGLDMLTLLPSRQRMEQRLAETIALSKRTGQQGAVLFLDLENFKPLNNEYGHAAGDALLQEVAQRLTGCIREMDMAARFGGDEFVIMLSELGVDGEEAKKRAAVAAEKVGDALAEPYRIPVRSERDTCSLVVHHCTASIGVEMFAGGAMSEDDILKRANDAMYKAKRSGRNAISFHEEVHHAWENPEVPTVP